MSTDLIHQIVRQAFRGATEAEQAGLINVARVVEYPSNYRLINEGAVEHVFYILAEGQVAITQKVSSNDERVLAVRKPGEFFGEMALIENKPRAASATTLTQATVLEISEEMFNLFLVQSPNLALALIRRITDNLRATDKASIAELSRKNQELAKAYDDLKAAQSELVKKERLEREMEIAGEVQRSLLPSHFPNVAGYSFAGRNVPARHVGGDLYDVIKIDGEHLGLLMADVSDKSVHAALIMAVTRTLYLSHARRSLSPAEVSLAVHNGLIEVSSNDDMFVTVFYGVLHTPSGRLRYIRGGQDKPLVFRPNVAEPETLDAEGRFLGMWPGLNLEERETFLLPGDLFVAFSDGVPDAVDQNNIAYSLERLVALLQKCRGLTANQVCQAVFDDVFRFRGPAPAFDDITVLVVQRAHA